MIDPKAALLDAIVLHVPFDGWSPAAFDAAVADTGLSMAEAKVACPRGALDLAAAFHRAGDDAMVTALEAADLSDMRFRDRVAFAIRARLGAVDDKEVVRRGTTLFALPIHAAEGASLIWGTADRIWTALGDTSQDVNWYTKRATLSGVYGATVLYWMGDDSSNHQATDDFIDRRIGEVMQIETLKARVNDSAVLRPFMAPVAQLMSLIKAPKADRVEGVPGYWAPHSDR